LDGSFSYAWSCKNGERIKRFSAEEFVAYEQSRKAGQTSKDSSGAEAARFVMICEN